MPFVQTKFKIFKIRFHITSSFIYLSEKLQYFDMLPFENLLALKENIFPIDWITAMPRFLPIDICPGKNILHKVLFTFDSECLIRNLNILKIIYKKSDKMYLLHSFANCSKLYLLYTSLIKIRFPKSFYSFRKIFLGLSDL